MIRHLRSLRPLALALIVWGCGDELTRCPEAALADCAPGLEWSAEACACRPRDCRASLEPAASLYARYEGVGLENRCVADRDCIAGGCSGEVCAAEPAITTCEAIPAPAGSCLCLEGTCLWSVCETTR